MTPRRDLGSVLLRAGAAGAVALVPLAAWVVYRTLPFNSLDSGPRWGLAVLFLVAYGGIGLLSGAAVGLLGHLVTRGRGRGWMAGAAPLLVGVAYWIAAARFRVPDPRIAGLLAALVVAGLVLLVGRALRGRGGRAATVALGLGLVGLAATVGSGDPADAPRDPGLMDRLADLPAAPAPVLVLALDGVEAEILAEMRAAGEVPHLDTLIRRGAFGAIETLEPTWSPPIWTTLWTGKLPSEHGITYFVSRGTFRFGDHNVVVPRLLGAQRIAALALPGVAVPVNQRQRRSTAVWEALGLAGRTSVMANRILSWPALPVRGADLSERLVRPGDPGPEAAFPPELVDPVRRRVEAVAPLADPDLAAVPWLATTLAREAELWRVATGTARADSASLVILYTHMIDSAQHRYLKYHWPERFRFSPSEEGVETFGRVIRATYRAVDAMVGEAVGTMAPETRVLVVSDHGVRPNLALTRDRPEPEGLTTMPPARDGQVSGVHGEAPDGIFLLAGPGIPAGGLPWRPHVLEIAPLLLDLLGLPEAEDMERSSPLRRHPGISPGSGLDPVASYEGWIPRRPEAVGSASDPAILEELRALGYIE